MDTTLQCQVLALIISFTLILRKHIMPKLKNLKVMAKLVYERYWALMSFQYEFTATGGPNLIVIKAAV